MPLISVVIPSYNHAAYVEACLDSVYFQNYPDLEIIIVDDCSSDGSPEIIERWLERVASEEASFASNYNEESGEIERTRHKRYDRPGRNIVYRRNTVNIGSTANYNRGFRLASGKFCTFIASDDIAHPQMLSTLARPLTQGIADFAYADMLIIDDGQRILREFRLPDYSFEACFCRWYLCGVATLYRRSLHERFGYYDENSAADDHECYLRFAMNGARFVHVAQSLYSVRSHETRQVALHAPDNFKRLLDESKRLCLKARQWLAQQGT